MEHIGFAMHLLTALHGWILFIALSSQNTKHKEKKTQNTEHKGKAQNTKQKHKKQRKNTKHKEKTQSWTQGLKDWTHLQMEGVYATLDYRFILFLPIMCLVWILLCQILADHPSSRDISRQKAHLWLQLLSLTNWSQQNFEPTDCTWNLNHFS